MPRHPGGGQFVIDHSAGVTQFRRQTHGILHELDVFVDVEDPVKFSRLTLTNAGDAPRTLSLFAYNDWVLGPPRESQTGQITTTYDETGGTILARNPYSDEFAARPGVCPRQRDAALRDREPAGVHRAQWVAPPAGRLAPPDAGSGVWRRPRSVRGPARAAGAAAGRTPPDLFLLGQGKDQAHVSSLIARHATPDAAASALGRVHESWNATLDTVRVQTPDDSFDVLITGGWSIRT